MLTSSAATASRRRWCWRSAHQACSATLGDRRLPFELLVDETREVTKAYGVWHRIGLDAWNIARPAVFLIERDGSIGYSFIGQSQREFPSLEEILRAI